MIVVFAAALPFLNAKESVLENEAGKLIWSAQKGIEFYPRLEEVPAVLGSRSDKIDPKYQQKADWSLILFDKDPRPGKKNPRLTIESNDQTPKITETENGFSLIYDSLRLKDRALALSLKLHFLKKDHAFEVRAEIDNRTDGLIVDRIIGPVLNNIDLDFAKFPVIWPGGIGAKISAPPQKDQKFYDYCTVRWKNYAPNSPKIKEIYTRYPGNMCTMAWFALAGEKCGLYFGSADPAFGIKDFSFRYHTESKMSSIALSYYVMLQAGQKWSGLLYELCPYQGSWHKAADHYRKSIDPNGSFVRKAPQWIRDCSGMFLCILKQQNGRHVMWNYSDIGTSMSDCADRLGFDLLALFGWAHGGHDHLYPDYFPDPVLGGKEALKKGIRQAKDRGKRIYLYANGQLIDQANEKFWSEAGESISILNENGTPVVENWRKFTDTPGYRFGCACLYDERWFDKMLGLAIQANDLGADGILYDQLAVGSPRICFSKDHGHAVPAMVRGSDANRMLKRIADHMSRINPDFVIFTEGLHDSELPSIPFFHASIPGFYHVPKQESVLHWMKDDVPIRNMPELFRYTFPESRISLRNPFPVEHRRFVNAALLYGFKHEVESRYPTDVETLKTGEYPTMESYKKDCITGLDGQKVQRAEFTSGRAADHFEYQRQVSAMQKEYKDLLISGKFIDTCGFSWKGKVIAKAYKNGTDLAVLVWNPASDPVDFAVEVPQGSLRKAVSPEQKEIKQPFEKLGPDSVRLLIYSMK